MGLHTAGRLLRQSRHAAARRADPRGGQARAGASPRSATTTRRSADMIDERAIVNGVVGLHATGGSTNHTIHLVAMAARRRHPADLAGHFRPVRRRAAAGARLSERPRRREPFPRGRRHGLPDPRTARRRASCTRTCRPSGATGSRAYAVEAEARRGRHRAARGRARGERRRQGAGARRQGRSSRPAG